MAVKLKKSASKRSTKRRAILMPRAPPRVPRRACIAKKRKETGKDKAPPEMRSEARLTARIQRVVTLIQASKRTARGCN